VRETASPPIIGKETLVKEILGALLLVCLSALPAIAEGRIETENTMQVEPIHLKLATTTSTENSGLLAAILPVFTEKTGIVVDVIAVGTGKALTLGQNGDVDVVMVHARAREDEFVADGYGVNRRDVMHNDFIILGSESDPAGIKGNPDAAAALGTIQAAESSFISRGDDSGTHSKEKSLWQAANLAPEGVWYKEVGQGMGAVLTMTDDMQGYTLADRGTHLAMMDKLDLVICVEGDERLFNPYGVIAVNPALHPHVEYEGAMLFIAFLTSPSGQELIGSYERNGEVLFYPDAGHPPR
jgi:tungstate transport system substrate-binding protein